MVFYLDGAKLDALANCFCLIILANLREKVFLGLRATQIREKLRRLAGKA